jgi:hypothetical protein
MCVVSMIHDYGRDRIDPPMWRQPGVFDDFQKLVEMAEQFDKRAKQPHCEDPEKTKFMEDLKKSLGKEVQAAEKARDTAERQVAALEQEVASLKAQLAQAHSYREDETARAAENHANFTHVLAALARLLVWDNEPVALTGLQHGWIKVVLGLPTGDVVFHVEASEANLFTGLPFGVPETDEPTNADNRARLAAWDASKARSDHKVVPLKMTPERVAAALDVPAILGLGDSVQIVARPALPLDNGLGGALIGGGHYQPPGSGGMGISSSGSILGHAQNGGHVG